MSVLLGLSISAAVVFGLLGLCGVGLELMVACAERRVAARRQEELDELLLEQAQEDEFVNY
ncbi:hypothetical protein [Pseudocowpox virus]|uniref:Uncharacterized protein n=1 Tax=Pseudocowpox virus TaxID=129726 RepID=D3IZF9_9POXV|nr:hypothetical protein PCPV_gp014 [Pseudocowpox virus]ADC53913.1 hypothetical protein [Pseudocowpox virus]